MRRSDEVQESARGVRIGLPSSISTSSLLGFGLVLLIAQLLTGTDPVFALLILACILITGVGFNLAGGLTTTVGVALTMMSAKIVIVSQLAKVLFRQPADRFLDAPRTTAAVLALGLASMLAALFFAGNVRTRRGWLKPVTEPRMLLIGAVSALVIGFCCSFYVLKNGVDAGAEQIRTGGVFGFARIFTVCTPMATIFATAYTIQRTEGRRSVSPLVLASIGVAVGFGVVGGTKMGIFEPILYYVLTALAWRFRFRRFHFFLLGVITLLGLVVVWPVMQTLKSAALQKTTFSERVALIQTALSNIASVSDLEDARQRLEEIDGNERFQYYGRYVGWLERFSLIEQDDELVVATLQQGEIGWQTITHAFRALVPSFIDPDKPTRNTGSFLARRCGMLADQDDETQIAFGVIAESFAAFSWLGLVLIPGLLMIAFVNTTGRLAGGIYENVWTVYLCGKLQHTFVEATISALIQDMVIGSGLLLTVYWLVNFVSRVVARLPIREP